MLFLYTFINPVQTTGWEPPPAYKESLKIGPPCLSSGRVLSKIEHDIWEYFPGCCCAFEKKTKKTEGGLEEIRNAWSSFFFGEVGLGRDWDGMGWAEIVVGGCVFG